MNVCNYCPLAEMQFNKDRRRKLKGGHTGSKERKKQMLNETPDEIPQIEAAPPPSTKDKKKDKKDKKEKKASKALAVPQAFNGDLSSTASNSSSRPQGKPASKNTDTLSLGIKHAKDGVTKQIDPEENERRFEARLGQIMKVYETRVATLEKKHAKHLKVVEERLESSEAIQNQLVKLNEKLSATSEHNLKLAALVLKRLPDQQQLLQSQSDTMMIKAMKHGEKGKDPGGSIAAAVLAQAQ